MLSNKQKHIILDEILKSNSFKNSKLNSKLLLYLVECEIENKSPSEYSIAIDVFKKDSSFNPNEDTLIRVSVYNLRKKLERYYQNMGKHTKLRVKIPKGHYEVVFFNYSKESIIQKLLNPYFIFISIILLLASFIVFLLFRTSSYSQNSSKNLTESILSESLFSSFIESENLKLITLGDDFIYYSDFSEFNTSPIRKMYRNSNINSEEEFEIFLSKKTHESKLKKLPFSFFNQAAIWPLTNIVTFLAPYNIDYLIRSASTLTTNDIKGKDIVFLGSFWTLGILENIITDLGITYNIVGEEKLELKISTISDSTISLLRTGIAAYDHIDYSIFIKIPGPNNNSIYLFVSFYATGSVAAVKYMTNNENLKNIVRKLNLDSEKLPEYFYVVFKSTGHNRELLSTEIYYAGEIKSETIKW